MRPDRPFSKFDRATDRSVNGSINVARFDLSVIMPVEKKVLDPIAIAGILNKRPAGAGKVLIWPYKAMLELVSGLYVHL